MPTIVHERIQAARAGKNQTVICKMPYGRAVLGDRQVNRGYCLLLSDPELASINDLGGQKRTRFLLDMTIMGDALLEVSDAFRMTYSILGNSDAALHTHNHHRYMSESEQQRKGPTYLTYSATQLDSRPFDTTRDAYDKTGTCKRGQTLAGRFVYDD